MASDHTESVRGMRSSPRLWVETLWILDSLETSKPFREIPLSRGLNLILSEPGNGSTGHGVGKTAFCQLLRYVLEDPNWGAGSTLRDELRHSFPEGGAAARVHVDGEAWTVVKPWRHQQGYRAARNADWQAVARDEVPNEHDVYVSALNHKMVDILPVRKLPDSEQAIQWHHILAWCSRDQECRYLDYYRWRAAGAGFSLPAKSPVLLVKIVLGLVDDTSIHQALTRLEDDLAKETEALTELERRPRDLLDHVRHQLSEALGQPESSPFRATDLLNPASLQALAQQRIGGYSDELDRLKEQLSDIERNRDQLIAKRAPLTARIELLENQVARVEAAISDDWAEVERLKNVAASLEAHFSNQCDLGDILVGRCEYVRKRVDTLSAKDVRQAIARKGEIENLRRDMARWRDAVAAIQREIQPLENELADLADRSKHLKARELEALAGTQHLTDALAEFEFYDDILADRSEWPERKLHESRRAQLSQDKDRLSLQLRQQSDKYAIRREAIESSLDSLAKQLPGFLWGVFHDEDLRPFRMGPPHSAALGVLETLVGDFVCLADSQHPESFHPGFLLHDSPREAELSEPVFWKFLATAAACGDSVQYVVTTSTKAPTEFERYVRLKLGNRSDRELLFRTRLGTEQEEIGG